MKICASIVLCMAVLFFGTIVDAAEPVQAVNASLTTDSLVNIPEAVTRTMPVMRWKKTGVIGIVQKFFVERDRKVRKQKGFFSFVGVTVEERRDPRLMLATLE